ncbi:UNVERIFIED_CONTAM: hypothetical protein Slati_3899000 [Sesamum latifolium]|uniref:Uncharacterized protein n=1 Tax=Sesamum latifolium TaxID=2727402 RepID=A0AAW2TQL6_9LAMI
MIGRISLHISEDVVSLAIRQRNRVFEVERRHADQGEGGSRLEAPRGGPPRSRGTVPTARGETSNIIRRSTRVPFATITPSTTVSPNIVTLVATPSLPSHILKQKLSSK